MPTGTASNCFAHRGDMLTQAIRRTRERLTPARRHWRRACAPRARSGSKWS
ncbi:hypothetical protein [Streptomyces qinglanensis]|uniref:hypothetical protein n=1 Tax=Streptomyces qinglanensis TaxID=943816 RepID=UPI0037BAEBE2